MAAPLRPRWSIEGRGWPMAEHSRFVTVRGLSWHVQVIEPERAGPPVDVLMLHGLGGAGHSWRGVAPLLAPHARIIVPDLPGHGFTGWPQGPGFALPGQARLMAALMAAIDARPVLGIGHSAGAPILARMALDGLAPIRAIVAFNGAFRPFPGLAGRVLPGLARALALNPIVPRAMAMGTVMDPLSVERLIVGTGSRIDPAGLALYRRLIACPGHVAGALAMMAAWQLEPLMRDLPGLGADLVLASGTADRAVPPREAEAVAARVRGARVVALGGLGHLAHEEAPDRAAALVIETARRVGILPANRARVA
ncbi:MAG: alpha/beta fold hydrolase BchO [Pseudomonadota bacterium]